MTETHVSPAELEATVVRHRGLARRLAARYFKPGGEPFEDLEQVALVGLVKAAQRYDPQRGVAFSSFAVPTILGELRRFFRVSRWTAHVPRPLQEATIALQRFEGDFRAEHGRSPTSRETADALGWRIEDVLEGRLAERSRSPVSLDARPGSPQGHAELLTIAERVGDEDPGFERAELRAVLEHAMADLADDAQAAFRLRAEQELTFPEVGRRLGVSAKQASRLHEQAVTELRARLASLVAGSVGSPRAM